CGGNLPSRIWDRSWSAIRAGVLRSCNGSSTPGAGRAEVGIVILRGSLRPLRATVHNETTLPTRHKHSRAVHAITAPCGSVAWPYAGGNGLGAGGACPGVDRRPPDTRRTVTGGRKVRRRARRRRPPATPGPAAGAWRPF